MAGFLERALLKKQREQVCQNIVHRSDVVRKREEILNNARDFLDSELEEAESVLFEDGNRSEKYMDICRNKLVRKSNTPESLGLMLNDIVSTFQTAVSKDSDDLHEMNSYVQLVEMLERQCSFLSTMPEINEEVQNQYLCLSEKAVSDKNKLEYEQFLAMGGEATLEQYLNEMCFD